MLAKARIEPEKARQFLQRHCKGRKKSRIILVVGSREVTIYLTQGGVVRFEVRPHSSDLEQAVTIWLQNIGRPIERGETFSGIVVKFFAFGVFVAIAPFKEGLVHISHLPGRDHSDLSVGQLLMVVVNEIDERGHVNLILQAD